MGDVVSLNRARKVKAHAAAPAQAAANRAKFGRTRAEKANGQAEAERSTKMLDGARRED